MYEYGWKDLRLRIKPDEPVEQLIAKGYVGYWRQGFGIKRYYKAVPSRFQRAVRWLMHTGSGYLIDPGPDTWYDIEE